MKNKDMRYYAVMAQSYFSDGVYIWEHVDAYCPTLRAALKCLEEQAEDNPQYVDFRIDYHIVKEVVPPSKGLKSDLER